MAAVVLWGAGATARADYPSEVLALQPLTYWRFNETGPFYFTATNRGTAGPSADGTYSNPTYMQGQPGALFGTTDTAARFDQSTTKIDVPYNAALNPASFSIECWAKVNGGAGSYRSPVTSRDSGGNGSAGYIIYAGAGNTWEFWTGSGSGWNAITTTVTNGPVVIGAWTHLVGTYDAASLTMSFYINGVFVAQRTNSTVVPVGSIGLPLPFRIGSGATEGYGNYWFNGLVDEVALYPTVLTPTQVAANYAIGTTNGAAYAAQVLALSPALYMRLDEPVSQAAVNAGSLGAALNGSYAAIRPTAIDLVAPTYSGIASPNSGLVFDGTGNALMISSTNIPVPWTMSCWVKRQDAPGASAVLMLSSSTGIKMEQWGSLNRNVGYTAYGVADYMFTNYTAPVDTWVNLGFVCSSSGMLLYANGELVDSLPNTITLPMNSIGSLNGDLLAGTVDEVATFNRALLQGQLKTAYLTAVGDQSAPAFINNVPVASPAGTLYATLPFSLNIDAYGGGPLSYQWRKDGTVVGTSATYSVASASAANNGDYDVIVGNSHGSITSAVLTVSINPAVPVTIVQQPVARQVYATGNASFTVTANGTVPYTYQWKKNGANIIGATNASVVITNAGTADAATYSVGVTNVAGGVVSTGAALTLRTPATGSYEAAVVNSKPASYWRLGESSGATAYDYMGGNDAVYTNVTLGVPGYSTSDPNTAVAFDPGNPDGPGMASLPDGSIFPLIGATPAFSLEAWVNWNVLTNVQRVFSYAGPGFHGIGFGLNTATGLRFTTYGVQDYNLTLGTPLEPGTWYHLVGVANGGTFYFYINGALVGSIASTGAGIAPTIPSPFAIGRNPEGAIEAVNGTIDEPAVYNRALTADEILTHYSLGAYGTTTPPFVTRDPAGGSIVVGTSTTLSGTILGSLPMTFQWKKDGVNVPGATSETLTLTNAYYTAAGNYVLWATNNAGHTNTATAALVVMPAPTFANLTNGVVLHLKFDGTYTDSSGSANDASATGTVPFIAGKIGQGVHVATTPGNNYLVVSDTTGNLEFDATMSFTVSFWIRYTGAFNDVPIIGNAINSTWQLGWVFTDSATAGRLEWSLVSTANSGTYVRDPVGPAVIGDGNWHNVVGVVDRQRQMAFAYVDGVLDGSLSIAGLGTLATTYSITIGQDPTGAYGTTTFDMDDLGIWSQALSAYQAASIYGAAQSGESFDVYGPVKLYASQVGTNLDLSWQAGTLLQSTNAAGPYTVLPPGLTGPYYRTPTTGPAMFYRVRLSP
jgi:hypothetical protein